MALQQQQPQNGDILVGPNGQRGVYRDGQIFPLPAEGGAPTILPLQTPADRRAEEAAQLAARRDERAQNTEERLARVEERSVAQSESQSQRADVTSESGLRQEFNRRPAVADYDTIRAAYQRVGSTGRSETAAGDLSLIFAYMKMLDPGSTVREGEFATAQNATGVPGQIVNLYNQAMSGQRLNPAQRADFIAQADAIYQTAFRNYSAEAEYYRGLAGQYGYNPDSVARLQEQVTFNATDPSQGPVSTETRDRATWDAPNSREAPTDITGWTQEQLAQYALDNPGAWISTPFEETLPNGNVRRGTRIAQIRGPSEDTQPREGDLTLASGARLRPAGIVDQAGAALGAFAEQVPGGDEAAQGIVGLMTGDGYSATRDRVQALDQINRVTMPTARRVGGIGGGVAGLALPGGGAGRLAAYGAAYGAGAADGGAQERATGGVVGAATGYAGGRLIERASPFIGRQAARAGNALADIAAPVVAGARNVFGRGVPPQEAAVNALASRALPVDELSARVARLREFGAQPVLADVIGDAGQGQIRVGATRTTQGRQQAADFAAGRRADIQDFTARQGEIVSPINRSPQEIDDVMQRWQQEASAPEFDAVRGIEFQPSAELSNLIPQPLVQRAFTEAATRERDPALRAALQAYRGGEPMTVGMADRVRRVLSGQADAAGRSGDRDLALTYSQLAAAIRSEATQAAPAYGEALDNFAARARVGDAADIGQGFMGNRGNTRDFVNAVDAIPQGAARDAARAGARSGIEQAAGTPRNALAALDTMATSRGFEQRANALLGPDDAARLQEAGNLGRGLAGTAFNVNPRGGSNTFLNLSDNEGLNDVMNAGRAVVGAATGRWGMALQGATEFLSSRGFTPQAADELVSLALDPSRTDEAIGLIGQRLSRPEADGLVRRIRALANPVVSSTRNLIPSQGAPLALGYTPQGAN